MRKMKLKMSLGFAFSVCVLLGLFSGIVQTQVPTKAQIENKELPKEIISSRDRATMRLIPVGKFEMGDQLNDDKTLTRHEHPVHTVYLDDFYIDTTEVTNAMYKKFMDATGHKEPDFWHDSRFNQPNQPVVGVSWYDAAAYAQWAGKRLPTEAEREKSARGGLVGKRYPWGDTITQDDANSWGTGGRDQWFFPAPVGSFPSNSYGLYDMAGNAAEWCMDEYDADFYSKSPRNNPVAGGFINFINDDFKNVKTRRVIRDRSWNEKLLLMRVSDRNTWSLDWGEMSKDPGIGFRCAMGWEAVVSGVDVSPKGKVPMTWGNIKRK